MIVFLNRSPWSIGWDGAGPPIFTSTVRRSSPVSSKNKCNLYWWHLGPWKAQGVSRPLILLPRHPSLENRKTIPNYECWTPWGRENVLLPGQHKSPFSEGKNPRFFLGKLPIHLSPYYMFDGSYMCGNSAFCSEKLCMSATTLARMPETCRSVTPVKTSL